MMQMMSIVLDALLSVVRPHLDPYTSCIEQPPCRFFSYEQPQQPDLYIICE